MNDAAAGKAGPFDEAAFHRRLMELCPWLGAGDEAALKDARRSAALERLAAGKDAWNAWANALLAERKRLEDADLWAAERRHPSAPLEGRNRASEMWILAATVDVSSHTFPEGVSFAGFVFPSDAGFRGAKFGGNAWFGDAKFGGVALFADVEFGGNAGFAQTVFAGLTVFSNAHFHKEAAFTAMDVQSAFQMDEARFDRVPDFIQAHFAEAPVLDAVHIRRTGVEHRGFWRRKPDVKGKNEAPADKANAPITDADRRAAARNEATRWRALKRIAIQAHDHDREQAFFAGELRARRGAEDREWHVRYWFGWLYEILSDFGRSVWRPFFWWCLSTALFTWAYLGLHFAGKAAAGAGYGLSSGAWLWQGFAAWVAGWWAWLGGFFGASMAAPATSPTLACIAGASDPLGAALALSTRKGLLFAGLDASSKADQTYACLYGLDEAMRARLGGDGADLVPVIPDAVVFAGFAQTVISTVLLFLLLLAIRNHFKIR